MTITQVLYVLKVAECGSMNQAAKELFTSQPSLHNQLKNLENEVGCPLFERNSQGVSLTNAGQAFCFAARKVASSWLDLQKSIDALDNYENPRINIGFDAFAYSNNLFAPVASFFASHPEADVHFVTDASQDFLKMLDNGDLDLLIGRLSHFVEGLKNYHVIELMQERLCVLMSEDDPRNKLSEIPFQALDGSSIIVGLEGTDSDLVLKQYTKKFGICWSHIHRADSTEIMMSLVRNGNGITLGPKSFSSYYHTCAVPMIPEVYIGVNLICKKGENHHPLVKQLIAHFQQMFGD